MGLDTYSHRLQGILEGCVLWLCIKGQLESYFQSLYGLKIIVFIVPGLKIFVFVVQMCNPKADVGCVTEYTPSSGKVGKAVVLKSLDWELSRDTKDVQSQPA